MSSFINDDSAVIEPYSDLPAMALSSIGFIVFIALMAQAYTAYEEKAFIAGHYQDAQNLAEKLGKDPLLTGVSGSGMIDASRIEALINDPAELMRKYGGYYGFMLKIEANSESRHYSKVIKNPVAKEPGTGIAASIPVTVKLNDVQELPGTLTVKIWRK